MFPALFHDHLAAEDGTWEKVPECTTGRVYLLKLKSNNSKRMYWMQRLSDAKDEEITTKMTELLHNPPANPNAGAQQQAVLQQQLAQAGAGGAGAGAAGVCFLILQRAVPCPVSEYIVTLAQLTARLKLILCMRT